MNLHNGLRKYAITSAIRAELQRLGAADQHNKEATHSQLRELAGRLSCRALLIAAETGRAELSQATLQLPAVLDALNLVLHAIVMEECWVLLTEWADSHKHLLPT
nr:unnamed protein product [Spirometra erinaceieuropaei]